MCELQTPRLLLKPLQLSDADAGQLLFPHWEIVKHLARGISWPMPADGVLTYYRDVALPAMERGEAWHWSIRLRGGPDHMIGSIALFQGDVNRGFWMGIPWQGRGLMSEAVIPVTDYWFDVLGFEVMRIPKAVDNTASRKISEKTGMRVVETKDGEYVSGTLPTEIWEITAEEWRARRTL